MVNCIAKTSGFHGSPKSVHQANHYGLMAKNNLSDGNRRGKDSSSLDSLRLLLFLLIRKKPFCCYERCMNPQHWFMLDGKILCHLIFILYPGTLMNISCSIYKVNRLEKLKLSYSVHVS